MKTESEHWLLDMFGVDSNLCNDMEFCAEVMIEAIIKSNTKLLQLATHKFLPQGLTIVGLLSESHISIHTYPEHNYVAVDVFTCGDKPTPEKAIRSIINKFEPKRFTEKKIGRGNLEKGLS